MLTPFAAILMAVFSGIKVFNDIKKVEPKKTNEFSWVRPGAHVKTLAFHNGTDYEIHEFWDGKLMFINNERVSERKKSALSTEVKLNKPIHTKSFTNQKLVSIYEQPILINDSI